MGNAKSILTTRHIPAPWGHGHNTQVAIPQQFIQDLLARADVVDIVGRYVQLKKAGANFSGLCPFHGEKSPSFTVSPSKQFFHCFGCGRNGNAIGFLMEHTGAGFIEVVHDLAHQYSMQVPEDERNPAQRLRAAQETARRTTLTDVLARAGEAWRQQLKTSRRAIDYLKGRGVSGQTARNFGLGYAPEGWRTLASVFPDYADPLLVESGLVIVGEDDQDKRYDRFRDRIMFPIRSVKGEVIGFGGRVLGDEKPKYLNSPETPVFHKGRELYGLFEARGALREHGFALVVEGYMDVVALAQLGFANTVATLGTACTPDHVQKLFRFTDQVVFSFDGDAAGRRAARKALESALPMATDVRSAKFLFLPSEHDPDTFIRTEGTGAFGQAVAHAVPLSRFLLECAAEGCDLDTAEGRSHMAANARPLWQLLPSGALAQQVLAEAAIRIQLGARELLQLWRPSDDSPGRTHSRDVMSGRRSAARQSDPSASASIGMATNRATAGRITRCLQIVLTDPHAWGSLGQGDQAMLSDLRPPHGPLFTWMAGQHMDHGAQPWAALREALRGHEHEAFAVDLVERLPPDIESDADELAHILALEHDARYAAERQRIAAAAAEGDQNAYARLRDMPIGRPR